MITPTQEYWRTRHREPKALLKGADAMVNRLIGQFKRRGSLANDWWNDVRAMEAEEKAVAKLSDHRLREMLREYRGRIRRGGRESDAVIVPAAAAIREASDRQLGLRPFPVQLLGMLVLHHGFLAEMATGEGKTLTAGLAAILAGWSRKPCHIITVNDYLVKRDAEWLRPLYQFCGARVGYVTAGMAPEERREGYDADITYATSKEVLADFLRDGLYVGTLRNPTRRLIRLMLRPQAQARQGLVMRGLHTAIVDEADSVLIDEAVTPLIISAPHQNQVLQDAVETAQQIVEPLEPHADYDVNLRYREVELTSQGKNRIQDGCASLNGIWRSADRRMELIRQALVAREFFRLGKQYVIDDGKIIIVDEFTGRPMPQRTWRQGMHQAIEAKEGLPISQPTETIARMSFQRFFRLYFTMSGMTGTAREGADEFWQIYRLPVVYIPPNKPCVRVHRPDRIFATEDQKWEAITDEIERVHETGRPVLVGTRSVAASELLASKLRDRSRYFRLLNAVHHQEEAAIVAVAGDADHITISTNMAGRGTDIKLGRGIADRGGLHVIATERHESGRVDRQLFGRAARQGDPGSAQTFVSVEDELIRRYLPKALQHQLRAAFARHLPGRVGMARAAFALAQRNAQRQAYRQRQKVLRTDTWLEEALSFTGTGGV